MFNPFKNEKKEAEDQQKKELDYQQSYAILNNPNTTSDEQMNMDRRDVLVQLSQWQQDRTPAMKKLFLKLSAHYYDETTKQLKPHQWDKPYLTLWGASKIVGFIETLDHNVMLANWSDTIINLTLRDAIAHPLRRFIFMNREELGLSIEHGEYVFWTIMNTVEPNFWRGWNDGERRKDKEIIKVNEIRNPYFQEKKKGFFETTK